MYTNKTKQYILAIILLAAFATGFECSNSEEEPVSGSFSFSSGGTSLPNTQTPPPSSAQYTLKLLDVDVNGILGNTNKCRIVITKTENGTVTTIDAAELPNLTLTATKDINDGTAATLQGGVNALTLADTDIKAGKIEKEVTVKRGTAQTQFTITLTNNTDAVKNEVRMVAFAGLTEFTLELLDLARTKSFGLGEAEGRLTDTNKCTIKITKRDPRGSFFIPIQAAELPNLALTSTPDINDGTAATLQGGVNALTLAATDIKAGKIEKEVTIDRGTAQTKFTITLIHTGTRDVQGEATLVVPPVGFSQFTLQLLGLEGKDNKTLGDTNKCTIQITKTDQAGTVTNIDVAELPILMLTATNNVNDGTAATLQGGLNALKLQPIDIQGSGKIEKEIIIKRGTAETTFTITLNHTAAKVVQGTAHVVAPAAVFDLSITLQAGQSAELTGPSQMQFKVDITSKGGDLDVTQLGRIELEYGKDPSSSLSYMCIVKPNKCTMQSGLISLKKILEDNGVNELKKGVATTLRFCCAGTKPSTKFTNIKLQGTLDPDNPANYIKEITYNKPDVTLTVEPLGKAAKDFTFTIITTTELKKEDLEELFIDYKTTRPFNQLKFGPITPGKKTTSLYNIFTKDSLAPGSHKLTGSIQIGTLGVATTFSELRIVGSAQEATNHPTLTYTP